MIDIRAAFYSSRENPPAFHPSRENSPAVAPISASLKRTIRRADVQPWPVPPVVFPTPARDVQIICDRESFTILSTNETIFTPNSLAHAIRYAGEHLMPMQSGVVIGIRGIVCGIDMGGPTGYQNKPYAAFWPNLRPIAGLRIVGLDEAAGIEGVTIWDGMGGVDSVRFECLTFWNPEHSMTPLLTAMNQVHGLIQCYWCRFKPMSLNQWMGQGMKWGWRGHGPAQWDMRYCEVSPAQEHSGYGDNYQGTSYFVGITGGGNGRTFLQHTNRTTSGPTQFGDIIVQDCTCTGVTDFGGGGSDYTFSGCMGLVYVKNCKSMGAKVASNGAMVFWTDVSNGNYANANGYTFTRVLVEGFVADHPSARRSLLMASGVENFELRDSFVLCGPRPALDLDTFYGGPKGNGSVKFYTPTAPSTYRGFAGSERVVKGGRALSSREIDAMWGNGPATGGSLIARMLS